MRTFTESRLEFTFDDNWRVEKWDEQPAYRGSGGFCTLPDTLACDFLGHHEAAGVFLIEVKNFTDFHHANREKLPGAMIETMAAKVRDTLAAAVWTRGRHFDVSPARELIDRTLAGFILNPPALHVVLWLEDRPPLDRGLASAMQNDLRRLLLRWFKVRGVLVTSCAAMVPGAIPGLTVRPV